MKRKSIYRDSDSAGRFQLQFDETFDVQARHVVTINDGITKRSHTVRHCIITDVDIDEDKVYVEADPNQEVLVGVYHFDVYQFVNTDSNGQWAANFSVAAGDEWWAEAIDLNPDEHNIITYIGDIYDERDNATFHNWMEEPGTWVNPEQGTIKGYYWAPETEIKVRINGDEHPVPSDFYGNFTLKGVTFDAEDNVAVDDETIMREYPVLKLIITDIDYQANTISGTAPPEMMLRINKFEYPDYIFTESDADGNWTADFANSEYGIEGMQEIGPDCFGDVVLRDGNYATYLLWPDEPED